MSRIICASDPNYESYMDGLRELVNPLIQDYRLVLEIYENGQWQQLGEKHIRSRSLNYAKGISTNFCFEFEETRYFWGKLDTGWTQKVQCNGDGLLFVSRKHYDSRKMLFQRVEWLDPQLILYDDEIADQRVHELWINYRLRTQLEYILEEIDDDKRRCVRSDRKA